MDIGRAKVFRTLDLFASLNLVERVDLPGGNHAYVACDPVHHHHAICTACGRSLDVADHGLAAVLGEIGRRSEFRVTAHRLRSSASHRLPGRRRVRRFVAIVAAMAMLAVVGAACGGPGARGRSIRAVARS